MKKLRSITICILCIALAMGLCGCNNITEDENTENTEETQEVIPVDVGNEPDNIYFIDGVIVEFCVYNTSTKTFPKMWATIYFPEQGTVKDIWLPESVIDDLYFGWQGKFMVHGNRVRWMGLNYEIDTYGENINPFDIFDINFDKIWFYESSEDRQGKYKGLMDGVIRADNTDEYDAVELNTNWRGN